MSSPFACECLKHLGSKHGFYSWAAWPESTWLQNCTLANNQLSLNLSCLETIWKNKVLSNDKITICLKQVHFWPYPFSGVVIELLDPATWGGSGWPADLATWTFNHTWNQSPVQSRLKLIKNLRFVQISNELTWNDNDTLLKPNWR